MTAILIAIFVILAVIAFDIRLTVRCYTDYSDKVEKPVRAVMISDLHCCMFGKNQERLMRKIEEQRPDVVFLVGDIIDRRQPPDNALLLMERLAQKFPCYYVEGNHERGRMEEPQSDEAKIPDMEQRIRNCGVTILSGESRCAEINGQRISISGVQDIAIGEEEWRAQLSACAAAREESCYTILLVHRPSFCREFETLGFDLVLCGHTHGGQVRIPFLVNGLFCPDEKWFPKYAGGRYRIGSSEMIVGRGLMLRVLPRIFNPPEIVTVDIRPERN